MRKKRNKRQTLSFLEIERREIRKNIRKVKREENYDDSRPLTRSEFKEWRSFVQAT